MNLAFSWVIDDEPSLERFLTLWDHGRTYGTWKIQLELHRIVHSPECQRLLQIIGGCTGSILILRMLWSSYPKHKRRRDIDKIAFLDACRTIFTGLASNRTVEDFTCELLNSSNMPIINPLAILEANTSIRKLGLSSGWFAEDNVVSERVNSKNRTRLFTFHNNFVDSLRIYTPMHSEENYSGDNNLDLVLKALEGNIFLQKLEIKILLREKAIRAMDQLLLTNHTLKELDMADAKGLFNLGVLGQNHGLEILNISGTSLRDLSQFKKEWAKNTTLRQLNLSHCNLGLSPRNFEIYPTGLTHLFMRGVSIRYGNGPSFTGIERFQNLSLLDIAENPFTSTEGLNQFLRESTSLRTLCMFEGSTFQCSSDEYLDLSGFQDNQTLQRCDHHLSTTEYVSPHMIEEIDNALLRNISRNRGWRVKAAR